MKELQYLSDEWLESYVATNGYHDLYDTRELVALWKSDVEALIFLSRENEESRWKVICAVLQAAACLQVELGAAVTIPLEKLQHMKADILEVPHGMPHLSEELARQSADLWNKWDDSRSLLSLLRLAEIESNKKDVKRCLRILAVTVGILDNNISK